MAEKYGMLPTEVLHKATTYDFMIFYNASILRDRYQKQQRGENTADTYSQNEIDNMYADFKKRKDNGNEGKR